MPDDPFVREKFTKERSAARRAIREYFKAISQGAIPDRGRELAPSPIAKLRIHHEAAAGADRERRLMGSARGWKRSFDDPIPFAARRQLVTLGDAGTYITVLTCPILGQMIQHAPDAALHASE
jgi:hypothetical protein